MVKESSRKIFCDLRRFKKMLEYNKSQFWIKIVHGIKNTVFSFSV